MKNTILTFSMLLVSGIAFPQTVASKDIQIKTAVMAAPEEKRADAMVYGYGENGEFMVLRQGKNEMVCIADDPNSPGFSVAAYQNDLEPFMIRGRELKKEGKSFQEIFDTREAEAKSGKLKMPKEGATLFVLTAEQENYNPSTGELTDP